MKIIKSIENIEKIIKKYQKEKNLIKETKRNGIYYIKDIEEILIKNGLLTDIKASQTEIDKERENSFYILFGTILSFIIMFFSLITANFLFSFIGFIFFIFSIEFLILIRRDLKKIDGGSYYKTIKKIIKEVENYNNNFRYNNINKRRELNKKMYIYTEYKKKEIENDNKIKILEDKIDNLFFKLDNLFLEKENILLKEINVLNKRKQGIKYNGDDIKEIENDISLVKDISKKVKELDFLKKKLNRRKEELLNL